METDILQMVVQIWNVERNELLEDSQVLLYHGSVVFLEEVVEVLRYEC